jgi:glutathione S-transferase
MDPLKVNLPLLQAVFVAIYVVCQYIAWRFGPRLPRSRSAREFIHRYAFQWYDSDIDPALGQRWRSWQLRIGMFVVVVTLAAAVISYRLGL